MQYIANMQDGSTAGFKYFSFSGAKGISVTVSGKGEGVMQVSAAEDFSSLAAELKVAPGGKETTVSSALTVPDGVHPLYFRYQGSGAISFWSFELT